MSSKRNEKKKVGRRPIVSLKELPVPLENMGELEFVELQADFDDESLVELYKKDWVLEAFICRHWVDGVGNKEISERGNLSKEFIDAYQDRFYWGILLEKQQFDEIDLARYYIHVKYLWDKLLRYQNVSEGFVILHSVDIDRDEAFKALDENKVIPDDVKDNIRNFLKSKTRDESIKEEAEEAATEEMWESLGKSRYDISSSGDLKPDFIETFKDKLDWHIMLECQQFDEDFLEKYYEDYISYERFCMMHFQDVPESFVQRHLDDFDNVDISAIDFNDVMSDERKKNIVALFPKERQERIIRLFLDGLETKKLFEEQK